MTPYDLDARILAALRDIQHRLDHDPALHAKGICALVGEGFEYDERPAVLYRLGGLFQTWTLFSGDWHYPVEGSRDSYGANKRAGTLWDQDTMHGARRVDLLRHLVEHLQAQEVGKAPPMVNAFFETIGRTGITGTTSAPIKRVRYEDDGSLSVYIDHWPVVTGWDQGGCPALTDAASDVLAERRRQVAAEGWTPEHDDAHSNGEMARAAACYASPLTTPHDTLPYGWPWSSAWWKPSSYRRNLVKAAALLLAEIERLDRRAGQ